MVSGDPYRRSYDSETFTYSDQTHPGRPIADRVSFQYIPGDYSNVPATPGLNRTDCQNCLRAQIQFQSCWNGQDLYKSDQSHVTYLSQIDNGVCPPTHPYLMPHLFFEIYYWPNEIQQDGGYFTFYNGDPTGYGFHGDFMNGWNMSVLQAGVSQCINTVQSGSISDCPPLQSSDDPNFPQNCPQQPNVINEQVSGLLTTLPGCNMPTFGPDEASPPSCSDSPTINSVLNGGSRMIPANGTTIDTGTGLDAYQGCYDEANGARALDSASYTDTTGMTLASCATFCFSKGFIIFGTEYSQECYCGDLIATAQDTGCNMACRGNLTEWCGGSNRLSVWTMSLNMSPTNSPISNTETGSTSIRATPSSSLLSPSSSFTSTPSVTNTAASAPSSTISTSGSASPPSVFGGMYIGCFADSASNRSLQGGYAHGSSMTIEQCPAVAYQDNYQYFGLEYSQECFAGNKLSADSSNGCTMPCSGNSTEMCGGSNALSTFQNTNYIQANNLATVMTADGQATYNYIGCFVDVTLARAMNNYSYTDLAMTVESCVAACYNRGFAYAGLEYYSECYCSSTGASQSAQESTCS